MRIKFAFEIHKACGSFVSFFQAKVDGWQCSSLSVPRGNG